MAEVIGSDYSTSVDPAALIEIVLDLLRSSVSLIVTTADKFGLKPVGSKVTSGKVLGDQVIPESSGSNRLISVPLTTSFTIQPLPPAVNITWTPLFIASDRAILTAPTTRLVFETNREFLIWLISLY